jgi:hypothetical protein
VVRTVRVRLELDRNDFKQGLRDSAGDLRGFDAEIKTLGKDAQRTGVELKGTGTTAKKLGDDVKTSARDFKTLEQRVTETKTSMRALATEFERTGKADVSKQFRSASTELGRLNRMAKELEGGGGGGLLGGLFAGIGTLGGRVFGGLPPQAQAAIGATLVAAVAASAPAIGATVNGAILGGIGLGAIGAALAVQFNDPQLHAAIVGLGNDALTELTGATRGFVPSFLRGIDALKREMVPFWSDLRTGFQSLAPYAANLFARLGEGMAKLGPGLANAMQAAGPILERLAADLPMLLGSVGGFFDKLSGGAKGAGEAVDMMMRIASAAITILGAGILGLSRAFDFVVQAADRVTGILARIPVVGKLWAPLHDYVHGIATSMDGMGISANAAGAQASAAFDRVMTAARNVGLGVQLAAADFQNFSAKISGARQDTDALAASMVDKLLGSMMSIDQANLSVASSLTQVTEGVKTNGHELDIHTAKGQANTQAILGAVQANIGQYDALIRSGAGAEQAAAAYDANTGALEHQMHQAGFTQAQIDGLIGKYRGVPANVDTDIATYGLTEAINGLNDVIRLANHLDGRVSTVTIQEIHRTTYTSDTAPSGFFKGLAKGGVVSYAQGGVHDYKMSLSTDYTARSGLLKPSNPGTILAGEPSTGGEVFGPRLGVSHERGLQLAGVLAGWHGGMVVRAGPMGGGGGTQTVVHEHHVTVAYPDGRKIGELLISDADHGGTAVTTFIRRVANR